MKLADSSVRGAAGVLQQTLRITRRRLAIVCPVLLSPIHGQLDTLWGEQPGR